MSVGRIAPSRGVGIFRRLIVLGGGMAARAGGFGKWKMTFIAVQVIRIPPPAFDSMLIGRKDILMAQDFLVALEAGG